MRGEIYVLGLLKVSELAQNVVTEHMRGAVANSSVYAELVDPERHHHAGARYEHLAAKLAEAFRPAPPERFSEANFADLLRPIVRAELARILRCSADDALASLFDPIQIRRELDRVRRTAASATPGVDVEALLFELLVGDGNARMVARIRQRYQFGENEWGTHLQGRRWLLDSAVAHLREEAAGRGWTRTEPGRVLRAVIDHAGKPADDGRALEDSFDALAIVYLRRSIAELVSDLRQEAEANVERAVSRMPAQPGLAKLRGWMDMYERRNLVRGLLKLCGGTMPLHHLIPRDRCSDKQVFAYDAPQEDNFIIGNVQEFSRRDGAFSAERLYVTFDVQCRIGDVGVLTTVLSVSRLPREEFQRVRAAVEGLRPEDLSSQGNTIAERLLNSGVPATEGMHGMLRGFVERNSGLVAQTIVLCGIQQPLTAEGVPWQRLLLDRLPLARRDQTRDVSFPKDLRTIADDLAAQYEDDSKTLDLDTKPD